MTDRARDPRPPWGTEAVPAWHLDGACRGVGPAIFFEDQHVELAKRVCRSCPVRAQCHRWAIDAGSSLFGVWAATTWHDRQQIRRPQRKGAA